MNLRTLVAATALTACFNGASAQAATDQQLQYNAYSIMTARCFRISPTCSTITLYAVANYWAPPTYGAGSKRYSFGYSRYRGGPQYACYVYVRNTVAASGATSC